MWTSKDIQTENFKGLTIANILKMKVFCLVLIFLTSQVCFTEVAGNQVLTTNNREINQNKKNQEVNRVIRVKETKGLIILSDRHSKNDFVCFYNKDGSLWYEFTFYYDDKDGKFEYENKNFDPFAFHPDYFLLALKCVGSDKNRYEVIVNEKKRLRKFVKKMI